MFFFLNTSYYPTKRLQSYRGSNSLAPVTVRRNTHNPRHSAAMVEGRATHQQSRRTRNRSWTPASRNSDPDWATRRFRSIHPTPSIGRWRTPMTTMMRTRRRMTESRIYPSPRPWPRPLGRRVERVRRGEAARRLVGEN